MCTERVLVGYCVRWRWSRHEWGSAYYDRHGVMGFDRHVMSFERAYQIWASASSQYERWGLGAKIRRVVKRGDAECPRQVRAKKKAKAN